MDFYMNYQPWINYCLTAEKHIVAALNSDEVTLLQSHLLEIGVDEYINWINQNRRTVEAFLSSAPTKETKDAWNTDPLYSLKLFLAGAQFARSAILVLEALDTTSLLAPEIELPDMLLAAKETYRHIAFADIKPHLYWPFESVCRSPFLSDS